LIHEIDILLQIVTFYACVPGVSTKLLNWQFHYWHFNWDFISYAGVMNFFELRDVAQAQKSLNDSSVISSQGW